MFDHILANREELQRILFDRDGEESSANSWRTEVHKCHGYTGGNPQVEYIEACNGLLHIGT